MVRIPSTPIHEAQLAEFLYSELQRTGFSVAKQYAADNRFNVLAEKGSGKNALMFYGHLDTVPLYGEWNSIRTAGQVRRMIACSVWGLRI